MTSKKLLVVIVPVVLVLVLSFSVATAVPVAATDITVNPGESIQAALDTASPGDTILVAAGLYVEADGLIIDKTLTLQGAGTDLTTIENPFNSGETTYPLEITSNNVTIKDFTLVGPGSGVILWICATSGVVIEDIVLTTSTSVGIRLEESTGCTFTNVKVQDIITAEDDAIGLSIKGGGGHTFLDLTVDGVTAGDKAYGLHLGIHASTDDNSFTRTTIKNVTSNDKARGIDCAKITNTTFTDTEISEVISNGKVWGILISGASSLNSFTNTRILRLSAYDKGYGIGVDGNSNTFTDTRILTLSAYDKGYGIGVDGNSNTFTDTRILGLSAYDGAYGIAVEGNSNTFTDTVIETVEATSASGMTCGLYAREASDLLFDGGSISDLNSPNAVRGVYLFWYLDSGCTLRNITVDLTGAGAPTSGNYGIFVRDCDGPITICRNSLSGCTHGIYIDGQYDATDVHCNYNNIVGNGLGVYNNGVSGIVDATCNWWGAISGPGGVGSGKGDSINANVRYDPWLTWDYATTIDDGIRSYGSDAIELLAGWNTLSVPLKLRESANTMAEIMDLGDFLTAENFEIAYQYDPNLPGWQSIGNIGTDIHLVPGRGYYIKMLKDSSFPVLYSDTLGLPAFELSAGWNLIGSAFGIDKDDGVSSVSFGDYGICSLDPDPASGLTYGENEEGNDDADAESWKAVNVALASLGPNASVVISPSLPGQEVVWATVASATDSFMIVGEAYWVFMTNTGTLAGFEITPFCFTPGTMP